MSVNHTGLGHAPSQGFLHLFALALCTLVLACTSLAPESAATDGRDAVEISRRIKVRSAELYLEVHGPNRSVPLLLWLHGGPGGPERPLFRYFNSDLVFRSHQRIPKSA